MLSFITSSIRNKIAAVVLVAVISAVLVSSVTAALRQAELQYADKQAQIQAIGAAIATTIAEPVAAGQRRKVAATLNAVSRIPSLTYAGARDIKGRLLFEHGAGIIVSRSSSASPAKAGTFDAIYLKTYSASTPIVHGGRKVGTLTLIADLSALRSALLDSLIMSLVYGALAAAIGIAAAMALQRMITEPINSLTRAMQTIRDTGDFAHAVPRRSRDETGQMVDTFNDMLSEIRQRDAALVKHRDQLEATVQERTSDLRTAKTAAEHANAAKSEFLATMSHEIRTPMNGMLVMAELLAASPLTPKLQRYSDVIVKSGHGLLAIINDILDFSKIEAGKLELESIPVDPRRLIDDTLQLFSERAATAKLEIAAYVAPDVPREILADPVRLGQVLTNFVNNALKFTKTGGVLVSLETIDGSSSSSQTANLRFSVRDTGVGIARDKIETIFDAFAQADQSTTREFGGTGIGLSICKRLINAMGGQLSVVSALGEGSTFSFEVALELHEPAAPLPAPLSVKSAAVDMPFGFTRDALVAALVDWKIDIHGANGISDGPAPDLIFRDLDDLAANTAPATIPTVAIGRFGDTRGDALLGEGCAHRLLDRPLAVLELATLLEMAVTDPGRLLEADGEVNSLQDVVATSFSGIHVLAADDSPVNREVLGEVLKRLNVTMTSVEDGVAAVEAAVTGRFDLVFMDGSMPRLDGFAAARQIRAVEEEAGMAPVPIVALTAHVAGDKGERWRDAGMNDFIAKPFTLQSIEDCLRRWLLDAAQPVEAASEAAHGTPAPKEEAPLLDAAVLSVIRDIQAPDDNLVARVVSLYMEHAPEALTRLRELAGSEEMAEIADTAHALKSLSRNVGAIRVGDMAGEIEDRARADQQPVAPELAVLATALEGTLEALQSLDDWQAAA